MRSLKILALVSDGMGAPGGIARFNEALISALSQSAHVDRVTVLPRFAGPHAAPARVEQLSARASSLRWSGEAVRRALSTRFDIVLCGHLNFIGLAATLAKPGSARLWAQAHGIEAWKPRGALARRSLASCGLVTSVSRYTRARLLEWCDIAPERVCVLPNTVRATFAPRARRRDLIERHGLAGKRVVATVGRLAGAERYKGHDRLIRALPNILARRSDAVYLVVGSGDDEPRLRALAQATDVARHVVFAGEVAAAELPDYFALADVFAMPSTGEGFGIVFLEAAACGLPAIGGDADGSRDALADGAIGRLIDPLSERELADAVVAGLEGRLPHDPAAARRFEFANFAEHVNELVERHLAH